MLRKWIARRLGLCAGDHVYGEPTFSRIVTDRQYRSVIYDTMTCIHCGHTVERMRPRKDEK